METAPRTVNTRIFCHNCQLAFNELINPDNPSDLRCIRCKSEFVEILEPGQAYPPDPSLPSPEESPTRHGRYAPFLSNPRVRTQLLSPRPAPAPAAAPPAPMAAPAPRAQAYVHVEERPSGFTYIMTGPRGTFQYQVYQSSAIPPRPRPRPEEKKAEAHKESEELKEEHKAPQPRRQQWYEQILHQNLPQYMDTFMSDAEEMDWGSSGGAPLDPFSPHFAGGMVFGRGFPHLRLTDFFSEADPFFPTHLGVNLQDFGLNFASNFRRGNLIDLAQLISMADAGTAGKPPASKEVVSKLPIFKVEEKHCKKGADGKLELPNCAVCCSNINLGENAQLIPCGHMYHPDCIKPWFMQHNTCPICRYELPTDDPYYEEIRKKELNDRQQQRSGPHA